MLDATGVNMEKPQMKTGNNRGGDIIIKAGDGGESGNGGNLTIIGGNFQAGSSN